MTKEQLQNLIFAYDLSTLGIECAIADSLKNLSLTESVLAENSPTIQERAAAIAYQACLQKYRVTYPSNTEDQFKQTLNIDGFNEVIGNVITKLKDPIPTSEIIGFYEKLCLNLTKVDKDRQVK